MNHIEFIANRASVDEPYNGSWIAGIVRNFDSGEPSTGSLDVDLAYTFFLENGLNEDGPFELINGNVWQTICFYFGVTEPFNGSWIGAFANYLNPKGGGGGKE